MEQYYRDIRDCRHLTRKKERELGRRARLYQDGQAMGELVKANLRFVVDLSKGFIGCGVSQEDLVCAGNLAMYVAAEKFDERPGYKFITYAVWWVKQAMSAEIAAFSGAVRRPVYFNTIRRKVTKIAQLGTGQHLSVEEEAHLAKTIKVSIADLREALGTFEHDASLDDPFGEPGSETHLDFLKDMSDIGNPALVFLRECLRAQVQDVMDNALNPQERQVIDCYYGRNGHLKPLTFQETGICIHATRQYASQVYEKALSKLRHPRYLRILRSVYDQSFIQPNR